MSNSIEFSERNTPNISGGDGQIPYSLITNKLPSAIHSSHQLRAVQSTNGSVISPNTMIQFQIPPMAYLKRNSLIFRFVMSVAGVNGTSVSWSFNNSVNNCQAVIKNIRVLLGNVIVENIINYNKFQEIHLAHATNKEYLSGAINILEGSMMDASGLTTNNLPNYAGSLGYSAFSFANIPYEFCCELQIGSTNSTIPLWLLNQPLTIQIDTASVAESCLSLDGVPVSALTGYTITNPTLLYELIDIPQEVKASIKQEMIETGQMYEMLVHTVLGVNTSVTSGQNLSYNLALNLGSVDSILYTSTLATAFSSTYGLSSYKSMNYLESSTTDTQINRRCYIDGKQVQAYNISTLDQQYVELRRCFSQYNTNISSIGAYNNRNSLASSYPYRFYASGFNLRKDIGDETSLTGTRVGILQLNFDTSSASPCNAGNYYIYALFDQKVMINAMGDVVIAK